MKVFAVLLTFVSLLMGLSFANAEVVDQTKLGQVNYYRINYKIDASRDAFDCYETWGASEIADERPHVLAVCEIDFTDDNIAGRSLNEFYKFDIILKDIEGYIKASKHGYKLYFKNFREDRSTNVVKNVELINEILSLPENGILPVGLYHYEAKPTDPHVHSVDLISPAVLVERQFPNFSMDDCERNWVKTSQQAGHYECKIHHFDDMYELITTDYDYAEWTVRTDEYYFNVSFRAYLNYYYVKVDQFSKSNKNLPDDFEFYTWYIDQVHSLAYEKGEDFKIDVVMPLSKYKEQAGDSGPQYMDAYAQTYKFQMQECADNWQSHNGIGFQQGHCNIPMNTGMQKVYTFENDFQRHEEESDIKGLSLDFSHNYYSARHKRDFFTVNLTSWGNLFVDQFSFRDVRPYIERAIEDYGKSQFTEQFYVVRP